MAPIFRIIAVSMLLLIVMPAPWSADTPYDFSTLYAATDSGKEPDLQWFRDEMKISDKYLEEQEGILGMSWAHFFTMVVLVVFAFGTMAAAFLRYRRTQELLEEIRKEALK